MDKFTSRVLRRVGCKAAHIPFSQHPASAPVSSAAMRLALIFLPAALAIVTWCLPKAARAEVLCADDIVPAGMAVTATGTAASCAGACRAREVEPACGPVMKICAGQPVPAGYVLDSITTMPACQCLGSQDNAYVIRYPSVAQSQLFPYGNPPFGNVLCVTGPGGPQASASEPFRVGQ
jgi:hypothetical protein